MDTKEQLEDYLKKVEAENAVCNPIVDDLARLFGERFPLFIPFVRGAKVPRKGVTWTQYTDQILKEDNEVTLHYVEQFKTALLEGGNLAVKLGKESGGVLVVDFDTDDDAVIGSFLRHNPEFNETLRTRGSRGAAFWYRATGYYPTGVFNIEVPGVGRVGELRCGGCLAIVWGKNAAGEDYARLVDAPLIAFDYKRLRLEAGWTLVESKKESRVRKSRVRIDWDRFNETVRGGDGEIVEALVGRYFPAAVFKEGRWCCGNIGGETPGKGKGSFRIKPDGLCQDFDGSFPPTGIIDTLLSTARAEATGEPLTLGEIFAAIKEDTGEDFILAPPDRAKLPVLYLPSPGYTTKQQSGENFYRGMAARREYFLRDEQFVYIKNDPELGSLLHPLKASELQSEIELVFELVKFVWDRETKETISVPVLCSVEVADALLNCERAKRKYSLPLRLLASYPVLVEREGRPVILGQGYHEDTGGVYVESDLTIPEIPLPEAKVILLDVIADYNWAVPADLSRAVASFLGPGLKLGNILGDALYPLDVALGDQSGAGKTHRMNLIAAIYGEKAFPVVLPVEKKGVGSPEEVLSGAILSGRLFASIDNARGKIDLPLLESILRGLGYIVARVAYSRGILAKTKRMLWQLTSNAASFPPDLINRAIIVSHYKQPEGYAPQSSLGWGEVEPFRYIEKNRARLLGAIYGIISEYIRQGKLRTDERRHDFRDYVQSLDWIVTELLDLPPLLDGHGTGQKILSDPAVGWLRTVTIVLEKERRLGSEEWMASDIGEFCEDNDIEIPGLAPRGARGLPSVEADNRNKQVGKLLGRLFKEVKSTLSSAHPTLIPLSNGKIRKILDERCFPIGPVDVRRHEITDTGDVKPRKIYYFEEIEEERGDGATLE